MNNNNFINQLRKIYEEGNVVLFIGAGLSITFKIPDWERLIRDCGIEMGNRNSLSFPLREKT